MKSSLPWPSSIRSRKPTGDIRRSPKRRSNWGAHPGASRRTVSQGSEEGRGKPLRPRTGHAPKISGYHTRVSNTPPQKYPTITRGWRHGSPQNILISHAATLPNILLSHAGQGLGPQKYLTITRAISYYHTRVGGKISDYHTRNILLSHAGGALGPQISYYHTRVGI